MTAEEWLLHAAQCREVAAGMADAAARRVLLDAADEYEASARREQRVAERSPPAYQIDKMAKRASPGLAG